MENMQNIQRELASEVRYGDSIRPANPVHAADIKYGAAANESFTNTGAKHVYDPVDTEGRPATCLVWF